MRVRLSFVALVSALPFALAVACGGSEKPAKSGGDEQASGDDTTESSGSGESSGGGESSGTTATTSDTSSASNTRDDGPSAGDYASMPIVSCGKQQCAQGQICASIACRPSEPKCAEHKVCATPLNYKP